ncbi:Pr6Pr family membrane protein [Leifsonia aquatica]|uniref:Pr6Pr family membrane protein n=1 Tax=Leifsonia aquatica TaxID=144185 RepID=UPI00046A3699|nr:Pr6Pr family membrane protein [Leifsonia aquatica]
MTFSRIVAVLRIAVAAAIIAATAVTLGSSIAAWADAGYRDLATLYVNFFSYFTIESNIVAAVVLLIGAVFSLRSRLADPMWFTVLRAAIVVYMGVTGIVYNLLLRGLAVTGGGSTPDWTNEVMHVVGPAYMILDWLLAPGRAPVRWRHIGTILVFPLVWVAYTLVRGPLVFDQLKLVHHWYPYPFLNPVNGYGSVAVWVVIIALVFASLAALVVGVSHWWRLDRRGDRDPAQEAATA